MFHTNTFLQTSDRGNRPTLGSWTFISSEGNSSCGFNMQLMAHLITWNSFHFCAAVALCSLPLSWLHSCLTLCQLIYAKPSSFSHCLFSFANCLISNTALNHFPKQAAVEAVWKKYACWIVLQWGEQPCYKVSYLKWC